MADAKIPLSDKPVVTTFTDSSVDLIPVLIGATDLKLMTADNVALEIGARLKVPVPDLDAVDGLASLLIASLVEGEVRWVTSVAAFYVWDVDLTPAESASYWDVLQPDNHPDPGVGNGYWIRNATKIQTATVLTPGPTVALNWANDSYWILNNDEGGGITVTINNLIATNRKYYLEITTNSNALTVDNLTIEGGAYNSGSSVQTLEFYKAGGIIFGTWLNTAFVSP